MNLDIIETVVRAIVKGAAGAAIAKGWGDNSAWEAVAGGAVGLVAVLWGIAHQTRITQNNK